MPTPIAAPARSRPAEGPARGGAVALLLAAVLLGAGCAGKQPPAGPPAGAHTSETVPKAAPATQPPPEPKPVTIAFGGDIHFEGVIEGRLAGDPETALGPVAGILKRADLAVVNLETAITERGTPPPGKAFTFRAPASAFTALEAAGVDVANMANNHGMDFGLVGLRDSLEAAKRAKFPVIGIGEDADAAFAPATFEVNDQTVAIIGATQVLDDNLAAAWTAGEGKPGLASAYQVDRLVAEVEAAAESADVVVVYLHWGQERNTCPIERQQELARKLVAAGAHAVVGSHAHVLLGGGLLDDAYVHYGLGNFVFYSRPGTPGTASGVLLLTLDRGKVLDAEWRPATIEGGVPIPLEGDEAEAAHATWESRRSCTGLAEFEPNASR